MARYPRRLLGLLLCGAVFTGMWVVIFQRTESDFLRSLLQPTLLPPALVNAGGNLSNPTLSSSEPARTSTNSEVHHTSQSPSDSGDNDGVDALILRHQATGYSGNSLWETPPGKSSSKFLIFQCLGAGGLCGGWGDRQEGLVTVFLLAYLTHRRFGILMDTPCDIRKFVVPNLYDWVVTNAEIDGKLSRWIYAIDVSDFSKGISTMDFNARYPEDVVFMQTNRDLWKDITTNSHYRHMLPSWANQSRPQFFRDVWHTLMKPSPLLEQRLQVFLQSINYFSRTRPLVGVHVRTGGSKTFSDGQFGDRLSHLDTLWKFVQSYADNSSEIFVATDNPTVREQSLARFGSRHHDTQVVLRHIDRQRMDPAICEAFEGTILDQLILTYCDVLVVSFGSGFSSRAAMIRGTNKQLFNFDNVISPANMYVMCDPIC